MKASQRHLTLSGRCIVALSLVLLAAPAAAQDASAPDSATGGTATPRYDTARVQPQPIQLGHFRPFDARGINVFEPPKAEGVTYDGFKLEWAAAFTQQFQGLRHHNEPDTSK